MSHTNFPKYPGETRLVHTHPPFYTPTVPTFSNDAPSSNNAIFAMRRKVLLEKMGAHDPSCLCCHCVESALKGPSHHCCCSCCRSQPQPQQSQSQTAGSSTPAPTQTVEIKQVTDVVTNDVETLKNEFSPATPLTNLATIAKGHDLFASFKIPSDNNTTYIVRIPASLLPKG